MVATLTLEKVHWCTVRVIKRITWSILNYIFIYRRLLMFITLSQSVRKLTSFFQVVDHGVMGLRNITKIIQREANSLGPGWMEKLKNCQDDWKDKTKPKDRHVITIYVYHMHMNISTYIKLNILKTFSSSLRDCRLVSLNAWTWQYYLQQFITSLNLRLDCSLPVNCSPPTSTQPKTQKKDSGHHENQPSCH